MNLYSYYLHLGHYLLNYPCAIRDLLAIHIFNLSSIQIMRPLINLSISFYHSLYYAYVLLAEYIRIFNYFLGFYTEHIILLSVSSGKLNILYILCRGTSTLVFF